MSEDRDGDILDPAGVELPASMPATHNGEVVGEGALELIARKLLLKTCVPAELLVPLPPFGRVVFTRSLQLLDYWWSDKGKCAGSYAARQS